MHAPGIERIVVASSRAVYGEGAYTCPSHGLVFPQPRSSAEKKAGLFDPSCPDWTMWLAARGVKGVDGSRGPRFNQSSLVIEAAVGGRGVALAKRTLAQADLDAERLVAPLQIATAVDFAYYLVHPKTKGRLPQVKAFIAWITAQAAAHEAALATIDNGAGI